MAATAFPRPLPTSPELSTAQKSASTKKTCTFTLSLIESEGTSQQAEDPCFVDGMPNRSDIRSDPSDGLSATSHSFTFCNSCYGIDNNNGACSHMKGARVDIGHANSCYILMLVTKALKERNFLEGIN